jgi:hypothetical protein
MAAMADCQLTYDYVREGFKTFSQLMHGTTITPVSYDLLLAAGYDNIKFSRYSYGFGAGSFFLEDSRERSYWLSILHRIVAFNMGLVLLYLQKLAYDNAKERIANPEQDEVIQLSSTNIKPRNIPIEHCSFPVIHKKEWTKLRHALAKSSYKEYIRSGGQAEYDDYTKRMFQVSVKRSLVTITICQCFGPISLFWEALSPSCIYKIRHVELRAAALESKQWSNLNRQLWRITYLNPFQEFQEVQKALKTVFTSEGEDLDPLECYDYLEDEEMYKEIRNKVLEAWEARNTSSP